MEKAIDTFLYKEIKRRKLKEKTENTLMNEKNSFVANSGQYIKSNIKSSTIGKDSLNN